MVDMDVDGADGGDEGEGMDVYDGNLGPRPPSHKRVKGICLPHSL
jgi:hypothetical protein